MSLVIGGEGAFSSEFLLPVLYPTVDWTVVYFHGFAKDHFSTDQEQSLAAFLQMPLPQFAAHIASYYGLSQGQWPLPIPEMLRTLYRSVEASAIVEEIHGTHDSKRPILHYSRLLVDHSLTDWNYQLTSRSSRILVVDPITNAECAIEEIRHAGRQIDYRVCDQWYSTDELTTRFEKFRFTGDRSIIRLLPHGSLSFLPWYVRTHTPRCPSAASLEIPRLLNPVYSKTVDRRRTFTAQPDDLPWGFLWDVLAMSHLAPQLLEDKILRCAPRFTLGRLRTRSAARDIICGIQEGFTRDSCTREFASLFEDAIGCSTNLLPLHFYTRLRVLLYLRVFRRRLFCESTQSALEFYDSAKTAFFRDLDALGDAAGDTLGALLTQIVATIKNEEADYDINLIMSPCRRLEKHLREKCVDNIVGIWATTETALRLTPGRMFCSLPLASHIHATREHEGNHPPDRFCLICCRKG